MATGKINYASASDISITLASLASDTNLLTGQESAAIDNTVDGRRDYWISGKVTTGTSPTTAKSIQVWLTGSWDGVTWNDTMAGTNSSKTFTSSNHKNAVARYVCEMAIDSTSNRTYFFGPVLVSSVFGGDIPPKFSVWISQNSGVALNATSSNHQVRLQPVYDTVT